MTKGPAGDPKAARERAAVEMIAREEPALRRTARRYSLCAEDAEDAYQRALEIVLTKAPTDNPRELIRWTQVVTKHEALAIRRQRERLLGNQPPSQNEEEIDWIGLIPAAGDGPDVRAEKRERIARSREALRALKPAELRALTLLAEGYSYAEISEITGYSRTKVNRCLAEGRERFRTLVSGSEDGSRCGEMLPLLSAFCDGEPVDERAVREHLRACAGCRATLREYRGAAGAAAALGPSLPEPRGLLDRLQDLLDAAHARLPGGGGAADSAAQVASVGGAGGATAGGVTAIGGAGGMGLTAAAKVLAVCAGTVGGAAACVAGGVVAPPGDPLPNGDTKVAKIERVAGGALKESAVGVDPTLQPDPSPAPEEAPPDRPPPRPDEPAQTTPSEVAEAPPPVEGGGVEYVPPPEPAPAPVPPPPAADAGSAAGEFGP